MTGMTSIADSPAVQLAARLQERGQSLYLGRTATGAQFGRREDNLLALGPTRCGKTSGLVIPSVAVHPGPVIVTSTRPDVVKTTLAARQGIAATFGGSVVELVLGGFGTSLAPTVTWSVTDGCDNWNTALDRAFALATTAMPGEEERVWRDFASDLLSGCLFGAALVGDNDRTMSRWIKSADVNQYYNAVLDHCPDDHDAPYVFSGFLQSESMADETRRSVYATVSSQVLGQFRYDMPPLAKSLNLADFVRSWGTVYLTVPPERAVAVRPLVAAFVEAVTGAWRALSNREGTLLLALDEVAAVAPLPNLPTIITAGAGDGIQCLLGMQEPGQASRWGDHATVVTGGPTHVAVFPGIRNHAYLSGVANLLGNSVNYDFQVTVRDNTPENPRFADHERLITERLRIERSVQATSGRLRKYAAKQEAGRIAAERLRLGIHARTDTDGRGADSVLAELSMFTTAKQVPQRRQTIEADSIARGQPQSMFLMSRTSSEFRRIAPWILDPLWSEVLALDETIIIP